MTSGHAYSPGPPAPLPSQPLAGPLHERRPIVAGHNDTPILADRVQCIRCKTAMVIRTAVDFSWYECECPRRIALEDLDAIVLGLAHEHCRQLGDRKFLTLDNELEMIDRLVVTVNVGLDWSSPTVDWRNVAIHMAPVRDGVDSSASGTDPE